MKWCEHIKPYLGIQVPSMGWVTQFPVECWMCCPICGTPRPKEKTLREKFQSFLESRVENSLGYMTKEQKAADQLAEIAEAHYASH